MSVRKARGFTIFEMMVVLAIVAMISAFAIPAFQDVMASTRVNSVAEELTGSIAMARNTAISRRRTVVLVPDPVSFPSWTLHLDSSAGEVLSSHRFEGTVRLASATDVEEITFMPSGFVQKTLPAPAAPLDLVLTVCDSSSRREFGRTLFVTRVGRIRSVPNASLATCNP